MPSLARFSSTNVIVKRVLRTRSRRPPFSTPSSPISRISISCRIQASVPAAHLVGKTSEIGNVAARRCSQSRSPPRSRLELRRLPCPLGRLHRPTSSMTWAPAVFSRRRPCANADFNAAVFPRRSLSTATIRSWRIFDRIFDLGLSAQDRRDPRRLSHRGGRRARCPMSMTAPVRRSRRSTNLPMSSPRRFPAGDKDVVAACGRHHRP